MDYHHIRRRKNSSCFISEGSSGKSVACDILYHLAGSHEQVLSVGLGDLAHKFQRSQLYGKILNISAENELINSIVKHLKV